MALQIHRLGLQHKNEVLRVFNSWSSKQKSARGLFLSEEDLISALKSCELWGEWGLSEGRVEGFLWLKANSQAIEIICLLVARDEIRRGLGGSLIQGVLDLARDKGVFEVWLEVSSKNISARNFYEKWGFASSGVRKRYYRDGADAINMSKSLRSIEP